jgi:hypothetical protein
LEQPTKLSRHFAMFALIGHQKREKRGSVDEHVQL